MNKSAHLEKIYEEIYTLNVCGEDNNKVPRDISKTNIDSQVMVIAEAMAPEQVRLSGVNYFYKDGSIGSTGRSLEKFLNLFDCSVYPTKPNCVYHTEIVHSFPGYEVKGGKKSIKRPSMSQIEDSIKSGILQKEIEVIEPKLILLMGDTAYRSFYNYILDQKIVLTLTEEIENISNGGNYCRYLGIPVIPIQHSSGANPRFSQMLLNMNLIKIILHILKNE